MILSEILLFVIDCPLTWLFLSAFTSPLWPRTVFAAGLTLALNGLMQKKPGPLSVPTYVPNSVTTSASSGFSTRRPASGIHATQIRMISRTKSGEVSLSGSSTAAAISRISSAMTPKRTGMPCPACLIVFSSMISSRMHSHLFLRRIVPPHWFDIILISY